MRRSTFEAVHETLPIQYPVVYEELGAENAPKPSFGVVYDEQGNRLAVLREHLTSKGLGLGMKAVQFLESCDVAVAPYFPFKSAPGTELLLVKYLEGQTLDAAAPHIDANVIYSHAMQLGKYFTRGYTQGELVLNDIIAPYQYILYNNVPTLIDLAMYVKSKPLTVDTLGYYMDDIVYEYQPLVQSLGYDVRAGLDLVRQQATSE